MEADPPAGRLFWRGDVFLVKYTGELGMGHEYVHTPFAMLDRVADILKKAYEHHRLEEKASFDMEFELGWKGCEFDLANPYPLV